MHKIYIPNTSQQSIGGGFTFRRNFIKGGEGKYEVVGNWQGCDIVLIAGATMTDRGEIVEAKKAGKKIVFRIDNMPKDSRNRGTSFSRMNDFAKLANYIVYQSEWAEDFIGWWIREKVNAEASLCRSCNSVIMNGVDSDYFYYDGDTSQRGDTYLIVQYNRDESKHLEEAFYDFMQVARHTAKPYLKIVGRFSPEVIKYNFDFFCGEKFTYLGTIEAPDVLGRIMRSCRYFYFPSFADACSNTLAEAVACGCVPKLVNSTGGSIEVIKKHQNKYTIQDMADEFLEVFNNLMTNQQFV